MRQKFEDFKDWWSEFKSDEKNKGKIIAIFSVIGAVAAVLIVLLAVSLKDMSKQAQAVNAAELIDGQSALTERNAAGGVIADIDWDTVIGYDKDGNPIYGTFNMVPTVGGYDMCGAPIYKDDMVVTGMAEDGLPIYGNYSAIEQARIRGQKNGNSDIDWDTIVAYDMDGNPIFGSRGADPNIIGYDMLGNPIYKGSVTVIGRTDSGLPIYNYSTIKTAKVAGKAAQNALGKEEGNSGVTGLAKELAEKNTKGLTVEQIKALINSYLADGVITDSEIADLASKTGLSEEMIRQLLEKYGVGNSSSSNGGINGTANVSLNDNIMRDTIDSSKKASTSSKEEVSDMSALIKELAKRTGMSEDKIRQILSKYMSDGELTSDELKALAKELGLSEAELKRLIESYGVGTSTVKNGTDGKSGSNGTSSSGTNGTNGKSGVNGTNGGRGISGTDGKTGTDGSTGTNGLDGNGGVKGSTGATGATGPAGRDGKDGKDATSQLCTVNFNSAGGSAVGSQKVIKGGTAVMPGDPKRNGYEFEGWYNGGSLYNFGTTVNSDITLTAKWKEKYYNIYYDNVNGATDVPSVTGYTVNTDTFTLSEPYNDGYSFEGWTGTGLTGMTKTVTIQRGSTGDRTYKANWTVAHPKVSFDWNIDAYPEMKAAEEAAKARNKEYSFPATATITTTYGKTYGSAVETSADLTEWPEIRGNQEVYGYYFKGWYIEGYDGNNVKHEYLIKEYSTVYITEDTVLKAEWEKAPHATYYVNKWLQTLDSAKTLGTAAPHNAANFKCVSQNYAAEIDAVVTAPIDKENGFTEPDNSALVPQRISDDPNNPTVFNYYYTRNKYALTVDGSDPGIATTTGTGAHYYGDDVSITATAKPGYKLADWVDNANIIKSDNYGKKPGETGYKPNAPGLTIGMPYYPVTVKATTSANHYTIAFDKGDAAVTGTVPASITATYGSNTEIPGCGTLKRTGYHFVGWKGTNESGVEKTYGTPGVGNADWTGATITDNLTTEETTVTLVAQWEVSTYTLTIYNASPASLTQEYTGVTADADKAKKNYINTRANTGTTPTGVLNNNITYSIDGDTPVAADGATTTLTLRYGQSVNLKALRYKGTASLGGTETYDYVDGLWEYCGADGKFPNEEGDTDGSQYDNDVTDKGDHRRKQGYHTQFDNLVDATHYGNGAGWVSSVNTTSNAFGGTADEKTYSFIMPASDVTATISASCFVTVVYCEYYEAYPDSYTYSYYDPNAICGTYYLVGYTDSGSKITRCSGCGHTYNGGGTVGQTCRGKTVTRTVAITSYRWSPEP